MPANNESSALDFDDDLPDFSTSEWLEKFDRAPVVYGKPAKPPGHQASHDARGHIGASATAHTGTNAARTTKRNPGVIIAPK